MVSVKREITEEEYKKALEEGPRSIVSESDICKNCPLNRLV